MGAEERWAVEYVVLCYRRVVVVVMIVCLFDLPHRWSALSAYCLRASYSRFPFAFQYHVLTLPSRELARKYRIPKHAMAEACVILLPYVAIQDFTLLLSVPFCNTAKLLLVEQLVECSMHPSSQATAIWRLDIYSRAGLV